MYYVYTRVHVYIRVYVCTCIICACVCVCVRVYVVEERTTCSIKSFIGTGESWIPVLITVL